MVGDDILWMNGGQWSSIQFVCGSCFGNWSKIIGNIFFLVRLFNRKRCILTLFIAHLFLPVTIRFCFYSFDQTTFTLNQFVLFGFTDRGNKFCNLSNRILRILNCREHVYKSRIRQTHLSQLQIANWIIFCYSNNLLLSTLKCPIWLSNK